jgi:hypothetical protein
VGAFEVGGITFGAPAGWTRQPSGGKRAAQFAVPSRNGPDTGMSASGGAAAPIANARFVAAIISGGAMPVQVRMTGPANTVSDAEKDFDQMIKSMTLK